MMIIPISRSIRLMVVRNFSGRMTIQSYCASRIETIQRPLRILETNSEDIMPDNNLIVRAL